MKIQSLFIAVAAFLSLSFVAQAFSQEHEHKPYKGSKAFERMKQLVGDWQGTMDMGEKGVMKSTLSYKLTAADSAIVETVFEGMPHEMTSVYHDDSKRRLTMTHYCAEHNQPILALTSMVGNELTMDLSKNSDIDTAKELHIHSLTIQFDGNDKMTQQWVAFDNGKKGQVTEISFTRIR
jgi:hypothetical protein